MDTSRAFVRVFLDGGGGGEFFLRRNFEEEESDIEEY